MAEINVERKKTVWPWIIAIIIAVLLIWALMAMLGRDDTATTTDPAATAGTATSATTGEGMQRFAGVYSSANMQLNLDADGTYTMSESPAGEGRGRWTHDASANALHLAPADGSQDRYFRTDGDDALTPLNPDGQPAAQMGQLNRQATQ